MQIDPTSEKLLSLTEAARVVPAIDGKRPHVSTLWRWIRKGSRGVRLGHARVGNRMCTSREALARFYVELAQADVPPTTVAPRQPTKRTARSREREIAKAEATLAAAGI